MSEPSGGRSLDDVLIGGVEKVDIIIVDPGGATVWSYSGPSTQCDRRRRARSDGRPRS
jgi:hypothetical protein